ncbi:MAG: hypothetical protein JXR76_13725 [Deltaproteobacteria bacterium]|nr:hypothetical protein [Deltaproteobacteria bacterium]
MTKNKGDDSETDSGKRNNSIPDDTAIADMDSLSDSATVSDTNKWDGISTDKIAPTNDSDTHNCIDSLKDCTDFGSGNDSEADSKSDFLEDVDTESDPTVEVEIDSNTDSDTALDVVTQYDPVVYHDSIAEEVRLPLNLSVVLELDCETGQCPEKFTSQIVFTRDDFGNELDFDLMLPKQISISNELHKSNCSESTCVYETVGDISLEDHEALASLGKVNHQSYWNGNAREIAFRISGRALSVSILWMDVAVEYPEFEQEGIETERSIIFAGRPGREPVPLSVECEKDNCENVSVDLDLYSWKTRACSLCHQLVQWNLTGADGKPYPECSMRTAWNIVSNEALTATKRLDVCSTFMSQTHKRWIREFIYDIGKSGTDAYAPNSAIYGIVPKYGDTYTLSAATTAWYYATYAKFAETQVAKDFYLNEIAEAEHWGELFHLFSQAHRLFCYEPSENKWRLFTWPSSMHPEDASFKEKTISNAIPAIQPTSGDAFLQLWKDEHGWRGHTGMVVGSQAENRELVFVDGTPVLLHKAELDIVAAPWPPDDIKAQSRFLCIGRIPDND